MRPRTSGHLLNILSNWYETPIYMLIGDSYQLVRGSCSVCLSDWPVWLTGFWISVPEAPVVKCKLTGTRHLYISL